MWAGSEMTPLEKTVEKEITIEIRSYEWRFCCGQSFLSQYIEPHSSTYGIRAPDLFRSSPFSHGTNENRWRMSLYFPRRHDNIRLSLTLESSAEPEVFVKYEFVINNEPQASSQSMFVFSAGQSVSIEFPYGKLFTPKAGEMEAAIVVKLSQEVRHRTRLKSPQCDTLVESLRNMLDTAQFSDVIVKSNDGSQFPVHLNILAARSPVFCAMLDSGMLEAESKCINIPDFGPDTVKEMLQYIYTGAVPQLQPESTMDLLMVADKYGLDELTVTCADYLASSLTVSNVIDTLVLADIHSVRRLKEKALQFISKNRCSFVDLQKFEVLVKQNRTSLLAEITINLAKS